MSETINRRNVSKQNLNDNDPVHTIIKYGSTERQGSKQIITMTGVFWYRWYIVMLFGMFGLMQGAAWNTWGPISDSALCVFGFESAEIDLLTNWGPISFILTLPLFAWILDNKGLRIAMSITTFFAALGCGLRCVPLPVHVFRYFAHLGQICIGIAGTVVMAAPPLLSNTWFPPNERITATSIATLLNYMGTGVSFLMGPAIVTEPPINATNETTCVVSKEEKAVMKNDIMTLMYIEFAITGFIFLCTIARYPNKPPLPPSLSASLERLDFKKGIWSLRKNFSFIMSSLILSLVLGVYGGYCGILDVILSPLGVSQVTAGNIGFVASMSGCVAGMFVGWVADRWKRHTRVILLILLGITFLSQLYFTIIASGWFSTKGFQFTEAGAWAAIVVMGLMLNATPSLGNELVAESAYPTGEAVSAGIFVWLINVFSFIFLLVLGVSSDNSYANFLVLGSLLIGFVLLLFFIKEPDTRLKIDNESVLINEDDTESDESSPLLPEV